MGNEYISDSIIYHISNLTKDELKNYMVIVMWSGIDRIDRKEIGDKQPSINNVSYQMDRAVGDDIKQTAQQSADKIFELYDFLSERSIPFVFSFYCNLIYPPYIPKRDSTPEFDNYVSKETLKKLRDLPWIPKNPMDFMFEFGFRNNLLDDDLFHPSMKNSEHWADQILLPEMFNRKLITNYHGNDRSKAL
jgi:hypothetical protein